MCTQSCLTLFDPMDCGPPGPSVHGTSQARILQMSDGWLIYFIPMKSMHSLFSLCELYLWFLFFFFPLQVKIKEATGLPLNLSNFVFCQYTFWDQCEPTVAAPVVDPEVPSPQSKDAQYTVTFSHCQVQMPFQNELLGRLPAGAQFRSLLVT